MILVDTSVWIDHFRKKEATLVELLLSGQVMMHLWIMGELACGNLRDRKNILALLSALPKVHTTTTDEVLFFIEQHSLMGRGIGYVDVHLLAAVRLSGVWLWTHDKRLLSIAKDMHLAYTETMH